MEISLGRVLNFTTEKKLERWKSEKEQKEKNSSATNVNQRSNQNIIHFCLIHFLLCYIWGSNFYHRI